MSETAQAAYERGVEMGKVAVRLDHHDDEIAATNRVLDRTVEISQVMASTVQTLTEARVTDAATRVATAQAVKDAKDQTEAQAHEGWSPVAKFATAIGAIAVLWAILQSLPLPI